MLCADDAFCVAAALLHSGGTVRGSRTAEPSSFGDFWQMSREPVLLIGTAVLPGQIKNYSV